MADAVGKIFTEGNEENEDSNLDFTKIPFVAFVSFCRSQLNRSKQTASKNTALTNALL
jgi:hypothetical protein